MSPVEPIVPAVDLLVRGGTIVTPGGSVRADLAVEGGRIARIEPDLSGLDAGAREVIDAGGLFVLPGMVDAHTHTRVASDTEPDRFFQDSVAAAFGGTTTFLAFNNPGTGSSPAAERSLVAGLAEWRNATSADAAIDYAVSLAISGRMDDPVGELAAIVDDGVPTAKAFMVFDFRLDDQRLLEAIADDGPAGRAARGPLRGSGDDRHGGCGRPRPGDTAPRFHAASTGPGRGDRDGAGDGVCRCSRRAGPRRPPLIRGRARGSPRRQGAAVSGPRPRRARTTSR